MFKKISIGIGLFLILIVGIYLFRYGTASIRGIIGAKEKVESAEHRLYSYEHFYDLYGTIKAKETLYESQKDALKNAETQSERARIRQNIYGIKASLRRAIEEYNADAAKIETKGKFKADDLPFKIKINDIINE